MIDVTEQIKTLAAKASDAQEGKEAMAYSQAANNLANAMSNLKILERQLQDHKE